MLFGLESGTCGADQQQVRAAVRRVADRALLRGSHGRVVMGDLCGVAVGATRNGAVAAADAAGGQILVARCALELQAAVTAVRDHRRGELVVAEGALSVDLIRRRRGAAVLRRPMTTRSEQHRQAEGGNRWTALIAALRDTAGTADRRRPATAVAAYLRLRNCRSAVLSPDSAASAAQRSITPWRTAPGRPSSGGTHPCASQSSRPDLRVVEQVTGPAVHLAVVGQRQRPDRPSAVLPAPPSPPALRRADAHRSRRGPSARGRACRSRPWSAATTGPLCGRRRTSPC